MSEDYSICGSEKTSTGEPCQRPAGWGTDEDFGPCKEHPRDGRPSKFTTERRADAIERAKSGATLEGCARAAGISYRTLNRWLNRGEESGEPDDPYWQFCQAFARARASAEDDLLRRVREDKPEFILERSYEYWKTEKHEVDMDADVDVAGDVTADFVTYSSDDTAAAEESDGGE
jgi:transposase